MTTAPGATGMQSTYLKKFTHPYGKWTLSVVSKSESKLGELKRYFQGESCCGIGATIEISDSENRAQEVFEFSFIPFV